MADTDRIKRNLSRMVDQGAPEADLDAYLKSEGFGSAEAWRSAVSAPAGAPSAGGVQDWEPRPYTEGEKTARKVGLFAQGTNEAVADVVGAPVDAAAWALRRVGVDATDPVGGSKSIKRGINWLASIPGKIGLTNPDAPVTIDPVTKGEKAAKGAGEAVGNALAVMVPAGAAANTARAGTVTQGVANALASQPVTQLASAATGGAVGGATENPWLGLAAGAAVPVAASVARGVVSPVTNRLSPQEQRLVAAAQREGIQLTPAQQTGSPSLRGVEETMARMPLSNAPMQNAFATQRGQFNRAVLARAGAAADDASPDTLQRAFQQASQTFDDLAARTTVTADGRFARDVQRVATDYGRRLETDVAPVFQSYMDDLAPLLTAAQTPGANPQIAGRIYGRIRSDITTRMRETSNLPLRRALGGLVDAMDDTLERSTSGALRQEWQEARRQYQALMTIDKAMQGGTQAGRSAGDIPFNALTGAVRGGDRVGYSRGRGQLNELARVGDYIAARVPNSGTPERLAWQNLLTGGGIFTGVAASGMGIPAAAAGAAAPWAVSRFYNSPAGRAYLTNQLAGQTNFRALYAGEAARRAVEEARGGRNALSQRGE